MKKKLLVLTNNPVAKIGIASYLSSIFNQYLTIQAARGADATPELMESADCILLTTENVKDNLLYPLPEQVYQMVCMRTFNHTYLRAPPYTWSMTRRKTPMKSSSSSRNTVFPNIISCPGFRVARIRTRISTTASPPENSTWSHPLFQR